MANVLRAVVGVSIAWFAIVFPARVDAQSCLLTDFSKGLISKLNIPTSRGGLLVQTLWPNFTADPYHDQITQLNPAFANMDAKELEVQDGYLDKALQYVRTMQHTEENEKSIQNSISNMEKLRDQIKKEQNQRLLEDVPPH